MIHSQQPFEFETPNSGEQPPPDSVTAERPQRWLGVSVLAVIGVLLAGLFWFGGAGRDQPTAAPLPAAVGENQDISEPVVADEEALLPEVLDVRLTELEVFEGQLFGLLLMPGVESDAVPPIVVSGDGQGWAEVPVSVATDGLATFESYRWQDLQSRGDELSIRAVNARSEVVEFRSSDGRDWIPIDSGELLVGDDPLSTESPSFQLSQNDSQMYAVDDGQLLIWDLINPGGLWDVVETSVALEPSSQPASDFSSGRVLYADDDFVIVNTAIQTWGIDLSAVCDPQPIVDRGGLGKARVSC